ncbi:MAG: hypothetical protein HY300_15340 [Verrucomicrobia bacterium]|nr:hypothetical protein [Verrucomicrobiota bacterium]
MKLRVKWFEPRQRVVAKFGKARLIELNDGCLELRGGSRADHTAACEWLSLFRNEAVLRRAVTDEAARN